MMLYLQINEPRCWSFIQMDMSQREVRGPWLITRSSDWSPGVTPQRLTIGPELDGKLVMVSGTAYPEGPMTLKVKAGDVFHLTEGRIETIGELKAEKA